MAERASIPRATRTRRPAWSSLSPTPPRAPVATPRAIHWSMSRICSAASTMTPCSATARTMPCPASAVTMRSKAAAATTSWWAASATTVSAVETATTPPPTRRISTGTRSSRTRPASTSASRGRKEPTSSCGIEHLQFNDGRIDLDDGNALFDTLYYMQQSLDVYRAGVDPLEHYNVHRLARGTRSEPVLRHVGLSGGQQGRRCGRNQSARPLSSVRLARGARSVGLVRHQHLSRAQSGHRGGGHRSARALSRVRPGRRPAAHAAIGPTIVGGFDAQYYLLHNPDVAAAGVDPLAALQHFRLARRAQSERLVRHRRLSRALRRCRGRRRQSARALPGLRLAGRPRSVRPVRHARLSRRPIRTWRPRTSTRSSTSCCSAPSRAAPPSPEDGYEPARGGVSSAGWTSGAHDASCSFCRT